jgi:Mlc titration factor MtfA (ptsG expression regulator)
MSGEAMFRIGSGLLIASALALFAGLRFGLAAGLVTLAVVVAIAVSIAVVPSLRRARIARAPFPKGFREVLEREVAFYRRLSPAERERFEDEVAIFLAEQNIAGKRGAKVDDELRVLVAASAIMLVFGRPGFRYPTTRDIVIYDESFSKDYEEGGTEANVLGMVHGSGPIIFSSRALKHGFANERDGLNVGLHEFAHVLDFDAGQADGVPAMMPWGALRPWTQVMHSETALVEARRSVLRSYAATNEAEFFAVATEAFFERPVQLRDKHPELYRLLKETYGQDPAAQSAPPA